MLTSVKTLNKTNRGETHIAHEHTHYRYERHLLRIASRQVLVVNWTETTDDVPEGPRNDTESQFVQFYEVRSRGPSDILGVSIVIFFVTKTARGLCTLTRHARPE